MSASDPIPAAPRGSATKTIVVASIVVLAAFVSGLFTGIFLDRMMMHRRGPHPPRFASHVMLERLDRHLDLTDVQRAKIREIMDRRHAGMHQQLEATNAEIERVLTPEQRRKFAKLRMRLGHRIGRDRKGPTR